MADFRGWYKNKKKQSKLICFSDSQWRCNRHFSLEWGKLSLQKKVFKLFLLSFWDPNVLNFLPISGLIMTSPPWLVQGAIVVGQSPTLKAKWKQHTPLKTWKLKIESLENVCIFDAKQLNHLRDLPILHAYPKKNKSVNLESQAFPRVF